jgi:hypothetical protein
MTKYCVTNGCLFLLANGELDLLSAGASKYFDSYDEAAEAAKSLLYADAYVIEVSLKN